MQPRDGRELAARETPVAHSGIEPEPSKGLPENARLGTRGLGRPEFGWMGMLGRVSVLALIDEPIGIPCGRLVSYADATPIPSFWRVGRLLHDRVPYGDPIPIHRPCGKHGRDPLVNFPRTPYSAMPPEGDIASLSEDAGMCQSRTLIRTKGAPCGGRTRRTSLRRRCATDPRWALYTSLISSWTRCP